MKGGAGSAGYAASKAGVIGKFLGVTMVLSLKLESNAKAGLTRALAAEVGKANIRVNVIVPGYIETDMTAGMFIHITFPRRWNRDISAHTKPRVVLIYKCSHDARYTLERHKRHPPQTLRRAGGNSRCRCVFGDE